MVKSSNPIEEATDQSTMQSARELIKLLGTKLPEGETPESATEVIKTHILHLENMRPRVGKGALLIDLQNRRDALKKMDAGSAKKQTELL
jgi:hypothetical protein